MLMRYFFKKYKFTTDIFYKTIDHAIVEHKDNIFMVEIMPFFNYGGKYYIESVSKKDNERTIYSTKKSHGEKFDSENFEYLEQHFISLSHDGSKVMIFNNNGEGIIIKE